MIFKKIINRASLRCWNKKIQKFLIIICKSNLLPNKLWLNWLKTHCAEQNTRNSNFLKQKTLLSVKDPTTNHNYLFLFLFILPCELIDFRIIFMLNYSFRDVEWFFFESIFIGIHSTMILNQRMKWIMLTIVELRPLWACFT